MCLILVRNEMPLPLIAEEDIPIFKVLMRKEGIYCTYYREVPVPDDGVMKVDEDERQWFGGLPHRIMPLDRFMLETYGKGKQYFSIDKGAIHSYDISEYDSTWGYPAMVKGVIPKGAWYYKGIFDYCVAYASTEVRLDFSTLQRSNTVECSFNLF